MGRWRWQAPRPPRLTAVIKVFLTPGAYRGRLATTKELETMTKEQIETRQHEILAALTGWANMAQPTVAALNAEYRALELEVPA